MGLDPVKLLLLGQNRVVVDSRIVVRRVPSTSAEYPAEGSLHFGYDFRPIRFGLSGPFSGVISGPTLREEISMVARS
jgi:hypothetical protein